MAITEFVNLPTDFGYIGLSSDTKPTVASHTGLPTPRVGSKFLEYNTGKWFVTYDGTNWVLLDNRSRLVDSGGTEVTESTGHSVNVNLVAGSATIGNVSVTGMGEVQATPTANTLLGRLKDLLTGIVLAAGTNVIGWVKRKRDIVETPFTGTGDVAVGTHKIAPAAAFKLVEIELHLNAAPTTGTQNLIISLDDGVGAAYDLVILSIDLVTNAVTDLVIKPDKLCKSTDVITAAWTNTDGKTFGLKFKHELV